MTACPDLLRVPSRWLALLFLVSGAVAAADGDLDPSFGNVLPGRTFLPPPPANSDTMRASALAVDGQGRVVVAGESYIYFLSAPSFFAPVLLRLRADGHVDPSFQATGLPTDEAWLSAVALQANGEIVVAGARRLQSQFHPYIARFAVNGTMICSRTQVLGVAGSPVPAQAEAVAVLANGKLMVAGRASGDLFWARFNADCTLDASYGLGGARIVGMEALAGVPSVEYATALVVAPNGRIYTAGNSNLGRGGNYDMLVFCEEANGSACLNWFLGFASIAFDRPNSTSKDDRATAIALDRQGRVLVAGYANWSGADDDFAIVRLLPSNGGRDTSFGQAGSFTVPFDLGGGGTDRAAAIAVQSDSRILLAGYARRTPPAGVSSDSDFAMARLTAAGLLDLSFATGGKRTHTFGGGSKEWDEARAMVLSAGRVVAGGRVRGNQSDALGGIGVARLQSDLIFADGLQ